MAEAKAKFRRDDNLCERVLENAKLNSAEKVEVSIIPLQVGFCDFSGIWNSVFKKVNMILRYSVAQLSHTQRFLQMAINECSCE